MKADLTTHSTSFSSNHLILKLFFKHQNNLKNQSRSTQRITFILSMSMILFESIFLLTSYMSPEIFNLSHISHQVHTIPTTGIVGWCLFLGLLIFPRMITFILCTLYACTLGFFDGVILVFAPRLLTLVVSQALYMAQHSWSAYSILTYVLIMYVCRLVHFLILLYTLYRLKTIPSDCQPVASTPIQSSNAHHWFMRYYTIPHTALKHTLNHTVQKASLYLKNQDDIDKQTHRQSYMQYYNPPKS